MGIKRFTFSPSLDLWCHFLFGFKEVVEGILDVLGAAKCDFFFGFVLLAVSVFCCWGNFDDDSVEKALVCFVLFVTRRDRVIIDRIILIYERVRCSFVSWLRGNDLYASDVAFC